MVSGRALLASLPGPAGDLAYRLYRPATPGPHPVVVYFHGDAHPEGQRTIVTETSGALEGRRVVRGREGECEMSYGLTDKSHGTPSPSSTPRKKAAVAPPSIQNAPRPTYPLPK